MTGLDDPRVREWREARAAVMQGLSAPGGTRDRYLSAIGPYLDFCSEFCPEDSPARRHYMAALAYGDHDGPGLPLGAVLVAFRATKAEAAWIAEQQPAYQEQPIDEQARLAALPYGVYLRTPHWLAVRKAALERADNRCQICNQSGPLDVHHRTYDRKGAERPADVTVLCANCHGRHHRKLRVA